MVGHEPNLFHVTQIFGPILREIDRQKPVPPRRTASTRPGSLGPLDDGARVVTVAAVGRRREIYRSFDL